MGNAKEIINLDLEPKWKGGNSQYFIIKNFWRFYLSKSIILIWISQVAQWVKNPPTMQETQEMQVRSLGQEDPLEKDIATHSSTLAWRIPWTKEPGRPQSTGSQSWTWLKRLSTAQQRTHSMPLKYINLKHTNLVVPH